MTDGEKLCAPTMVRGGSSLRHSFAANPSAPVPTLLAATSGPIRTPTMLPKKQKQRRRKLVCRIISDMEKLSREDIDRIAEALAPKLLQHVRESGHEFWIDPETHYRDHIEMRSLAKVFTPELTQTLRELADAFKNGKGIFWKVFVGMLASGAFVLAALASMRWWR